MKGDSVTGTRACAREGCPNTFPPRRSTHKFCTRACSVRQANSGRRYFATIGADPETSATVDDQQLIAMAEERGFIIHRPEPQEITAVFDTSRLRGKRVRIGIYSDTHLGSKYQQLTHMRRFVKYAISQRVDALLNAGDVTDGPPEMHKGHLHNLFLNTYDAQRQYAIDNIPRTKVPTYVISGNHDESWLKNNAGDIVADICKQREDLSWVGQSNGMVAFGDFLIFLTHPHDGIGYALSYKLQRRIEALSSENKPHLYLAGNYHKACHLPAWRNVEGFLVPSFQAQTPFMASKGLPSVIGGLIIEFGIVKKGIAPSLKTEWVIEREPIANDYPLRTTEASG